MNEKYYFDNEAAERPIRLIEKWLRTPAGEPFVLLDWEKDAIRKAYGTLRTDNHQRRYRTIYILIGKGNGKSGFLACLGIAHTMPEWLGTQDGQVILAASNFTQANESVFEPAKNIIRKSDRVSDQLRINQRKIRDIDSPSSWLILTGKGHGKAGLRPSCVLIDELHEHVYRSLMDALTSAMGKRVADAPIMWIATNAGPSRSGIAWEYHEKALRILEQERKGEPVEDESFLPIVFSAPDEADWTKIETAADPKINPALGILCSREQLDIELSKALKNPAEEAKYRRYYLSQWVKDASVGLDQTHWSKCQGEPPPGWEKWPCVIHFDMGKSDDLTAISSVHYSDDDMYYVRTWHFGIASTMTKYVEQGIPYDEWVGAKEVFSVEAESIGLIEKKRIAKFILKLCKKYDVKAVTFDRWYASEVVSYIEKWVEKNGKDTQVMEVVQGWKTISPAVYELIDRLKARRVIFKPSACLSWQAGNIEFERDKNGNLYPQKPGGDRYKGGRRHLKIDGLQATLSAIAEVKRRTINRLTEKEAVKEQVKRWDGKIRVLKF